ncbi:YSIRK-type signal peptide-containing protein, partial [Mammaliicoccus sp. E-M24]
MKNNKKHGSKKIDFIPNRYNKYSIRKFTVGTASILVGSALLFGIGNEAKADEQNSNESNQVVNSQSEELSVNEESNNSSDKPVAEDNINQSENNEEATPASEETEEATPASEETEEATPASEETEEATPASEET